MAFSFLTQNKSHDSFFVRGDTGNNRLPPCRHRLDGVEVDCGAINDLRQRPGDGGGTHGDAVNARRRLFDQSRPLRNTEFVFLVRNRDTKVLIFNALSDNGMRTDDDICLTACNGRQNSLLLLHFHVGTEIRDVEAYRLQNCA